MPKAARLLQLASILVAACLALGPAQVHSKEFTYDAKVNREVARRLNIPVYFAIPASARSRLPRDLDTPDRLIDFRHPDAMGSDAKLGLRLVLSKRAGFAKRLGQSGLVRTGDLLLTFRPEWGGVGAYPNVQMGISHAGIAYVKDGVAHNLDHPLDEEFHGPERRADFNSDFYRSIKFIHIVRPRNLTGAQRANLLGWATRLHARAKRVYPSQISFNKDYNDPKFRPGQPLDFVKQLGQLALGHDPPGHLDMFCAEFAWSFLALRDCDPDETEGAFNESGVPSCVTIPMRPMRATGDYVTRKGNFSYSGLADGPLLVIGALDIPRARKEEMLRSIFVADPEGMKRMSEGHRELAESMQPKLAPLEKYYLSAAQGSWFGLKARFMSGVINKAIPENYSPTSFLINTLLPPDNRNRTMDYVATIVLE